MTSGVPSEASFAARRAVAWLFFMNGALLATWVSRIPALERERGLSHAELGLALLAIAAGAVVGMPLSGALMGRAGSVRLCRLGSLGLCALLPCLALAPSGAGFAAALFGFGACNGMLDISMNAQAVEVERRYARPIMSSFHALFSSGGLLGAASGAGVAALGLSPLAHFTGAALGLGALTLLGLPHLLRASSEVVEPRAVTAAPAAARAWFRSPRVFALGALAICVMVGEGAVADWSALYLSRNLLTTESVGAAGYAAFSIAMAGGRFYGDALTLRFGAVRLTRASGLLAALGLSMLLLTREAIVGLVGLSLVGAGLATVVPSVFSAAGRIPGVAPGVGLSAVTSLGYLGFLAGPPCIGFIAELFDLRVALSSILCASLLITLLASAVGPAPSEG